MLLNLFGATRETMIVWLLAFRDRIADLERAVQRWQSDYAEQSATVARLTEQLGAAQMENAQLRQQVGESPATTPGSGETPTASNPSRMPGHKPTESPRREPGERRRRAEGAARPRMEPTAWVDHALEHCPTCGLPLTGGSCKRTREVIELPPRQVVVTEHRYLERQCGGCKTRCTPPPELDGIVCGQSRLGIGLVSEIALMREEERLPIATIQAHLARTAGLFLSVGAIVGALRQVAERGRPVVADHLETVRRSPVVHADETGLRENGRNGYVWTFSTETVRYFTRGSRAKTVLEQAIGEAFEGVLVSDFYRVYTNYDGVHQYCWSHLLRDVHAVRVAHPTNAGVQGWADGVHDLFERAKAFRSENERQRLRAQLGFERELLQRCRPYLTGTEPHAKLCQRIEKHLESLFVFVADPAVPATNNAAERSLRPLVTSRKISGGTRSSAGTESKVILASLFGTWRAQGLNPLVECRNLLASPLKSE